MIVFLQAVLAFFIVLGPLVLVHEFGHFIVAKMFGIGVPVFSIGFGPRLFGVRRNGTDYRFSAIPLGGYVRLTGDESDENRHGAPEEFLSRPRWQRFFVFVAGAAFNIVLAVLVLWMLFAIYGQTVQNPDIYPTVMGLGEDSAARAAGLERGDTLLAIAGRDVKGAYRDVFNREVLLSPETTKTVLVEREGERLEFELRIGADPREGHGTHPGWYLSWGGDDTPVILGVTAGDPAAEAGLAAGDRILAVGDLKPISELELRQLLEASPGQALLVEVERDGETLMLTVVPRNEGDKGRIGAGIGIPAIHRDLGLSEALAVSLQENLDNSLLLFEVLKRMVTQEVPLKAVSGPIGIAQFAREALITGPDQIIWLLGFFSLQLGILNLLPIPVLDGGHILILAIEGITRRELSERLKERVMQVGFVFLLAFMSAVIVLDIFKLSKG